MSLTIEQQKVVDTVLSNNDSRIIAVNSVAGSGKTRTADAVIRAYKPKKGFYTAFNKAIVTDSAKRFGKLIEAKTIHALAYKYIKPRAIEEFNYLTIKEPNLTYDDKAVIIDTLDNFFRSCSTNIDDYIQQHCKEEYLQNLISDYAHMMLENKIPVTFNYMLKCLHLMLHNKEIEIDYDLFVLDECQDVTAVTLEIFKNINADKKLMLGDTYQNIYSFMDTVNAFEKLDNLNKLYLTKSFRCSHDIAEQVEEYGKKYLEKDFKYSGHDIANNENTPFKIAYITRTNAMLIERMFKLLQEGHSFTLTRNVNEIFSLPIALLNASQGKPVFDRKHKYLEKEYDNFLPIKSNYKSYYEYIIDITEDTYLESVCRMLQEFHAKRINIYDVKNRVLEIKNPNKNIILTTAHAFKGLECNNVHIEKDLNNSVNRTIFQIKDLKELLNTEDISLSIEQKEDLNTYYVALSRAKNNIFNKNYIL